MTKLMAGVRHGAQDRGSYLWVRSASAGQLCACKHLSMHTELESTRLGTYVSWSTATLSALEGSHTHTYEKRACPAIRACVLQDTSMSTNHCRRTSVKVQPSRGSWELGPVGGGEGEQHVEQGAAHLAHHGPRLLPLARRQHLACTTWSAFRSLWLYDPSEWSSLSMLHAPAPPAPCLHACPLQAK